VNAVRANRFPGTDREMGVGGGAPGINAAIETRGPWSAIVLTNLDPPTGEQIAGAIAVALAR
jgi:hypothetical protein